MSGLKTMLSSHIDGDFEGFDDEMLFKLANGTYWVQDEYKYWYYYAYCPQARLLSARGRLYLQIIGQSEMVAVRQVSDVTESKISGEFNGWEGETSYQLLNGEIWQQARYKYEYKYAYMPDVTIYDSGDGYVMLVAGTTANVRRIG